MTAAEPGTTLAPAGAGAWSWDRASGRVDWDTGVEQLYGLEPGSFEGTFEAWTARVHPDDLGPVLERLEKAIATKGAVLFDHRCTWPDGSVHWLECRGALIFGEDGEPVGATGIAIDIDYRRVSEEERRSLLESERAARRSLEAAWGRLARLHTVALSLAAAVSVREVGEVLVSQGGEALQADGGFFSLVDHDNQRVTLQASRGVQPDVVEHYRSVSLQQVEPITEAVSSGTPVYVSSHDDRNQRYPDLPAQGAAAFVVFPISIGDRVEAVLAYGYRKTHEFDAEEELLETLAGMSAQAVQRARLHDATDAAATRSSQLESVIAALAGATTRREVADIVVNGLLPTVGASKGTLFLIDEDRRTLNALALHGYSPETSRKIASISLDALNQPSEAARLRIPVEVPGAEAFVERYPDLAETIDTSEIPATSLTFPLLVEGNVIGTLGLGFGADHTVVPEEKRHLTIVAGICAQALGRAQALEEARAMGERLHQVDQITDAALSRLSIDDLFRELPARIAHVVGCDAVRLSLIDESGEYLEVKGHYGIPEDRLTRVPVGRGLSGTIAKLGVPRVITDISQHDVVGPPFPDTVTSEAGVPLRSGDRVIGVLDVGAGPDRPLTEDDIELLERAGDRIATAIERSRAYELERTERARSDLTSRLSDVISRVGPLGEQLETIAELLCQELADCCVLTLMSDYGRPIHACGHRDPSHRELVRSTVTASSQAFDDAATLTLPSLRVYAAADSGAIDQVDDPGVRELLRSLELGFALSVPLRGMSGTIGRAILARTREEGEFAWEDSSMLEEVADRIGAALEGKITFERHRATAITLQHSLLPSELPAISGLEIAARYWPASESFEVGGDFYDVIELDDDHWGIMVGDVSGKGVEAAAMTGIARHTARAAARHGVEPSGVLYWVHEAFMEQAETTETYCTAVYGDLTREGADFRFRFAAGGHPLPIYRSGTGEVGYTGQPGTVLGLIEPVELTEVEVTLHPGDWMVIYTDGVTDVPVANAITESELLDIVGRATRRSAREALAALDVVLHNRYGHFRSRDDTAILILRVRSPDRGDQSGSFSES